MMVMYFGNKLVPEDRQAIETVERIKQELPEVNFVYCRSPEDLLHCKNQNMIVLDVAEGINEIREVKVGDLETQRMFTLHDFDLSFFLKILKKINKTFHVRIIALPQGKNCDEELVEILKNQTNLSLRKWAEQDMHGS